jgi:hypothetical protein
MATIIVEAGETSGTLIQARAAIKQGRKGENSSTKGYFGQLPAIHYFQSPLHRGKLLLYKTSDSVTRNSLKGAVFGQGRISGRLPNLQPLLGESPSQTRIARRLSLALLRIQFVGA